MEEIRMLATQDVRIGQYLTHPIHPLSYTPHSSSTSASLLCALRLLSASDSPHQSTTSDDLRLHGLLTNRHKLLSVDDDTRDWILEGVKEAASFKSLGMDDVAAEEAERALCAVVTNGVEVVDAQGLALGIGVYGPDFSWINHSCSPNACYRFVFGTEDIADSATRIAPSGSLIPLCSAALGRNEAEQDSLGRGPRIIVRSIRAIGKGEEVTIAYTDLLQPKEVRLSELWSKYRFTCCCKRCSNQLSYVDCALQDIYGDSFTVSARCDYRLHEVNQQLSDFLDSVIQEYLSEDDPKSCCEKLENFLKRGILDMDLASEAPQSQQEFLLQPLHHLSLSAFTTLASAYKAYSNQLVDVEMQTEALVLEAFRLNKISAAYSVLLAGVVQHLFSFESSLIVPLASFWTSVGESLLSIFRSSAWNVLLQKEQLLSTHSLPQKLKSCRCSFVNTGQAHCLFSQCIDGDLEYMSMEFLSCATDLARNIWGSLAVNSHYLKAMKHPIDFGWLRKEECVDRYAWTEGIGSRSLVTGSNQQERLLIFHLGVHCLTYGGFLSSLCYGKHEAFLHGAKQMLEDCLANVPVEDICIGMS